MTLLRINQKTQQEFQVHYYFQLSIIFIHHRHKTIKNDLL